MADRLDPFHISRSVVGEGVALPKSKPVSSDSLVRLAGLSVPITSTAQDNSICILALSASFYGLEISQE